MENKILEAALQYQKKGMSVIPVGQDKRPLIKWEPYQKKKADESEIRSWWKRFPKANVGIVTGEISDVFVVDTDTPQATQRIEEAIPDNLVIVCQMTPSGGKHFVFKHIEGFSNRAKVVEGIDIRTTGGYFVAGPSLNGNGKAWEWVISPFDADLIDLVPSIKDILISSFSLSLYRSLQTVYKSSEIGSLQTSTVSTSVYKMFEDHSRNEDLFHVALQLIKSKSNPEVIKQVLDNLGKICNPPWGSKRDDGPIEKIIESASIHYKKRERNLAAEIREECLSTEGVFLSTEMVSRLQLSTREEKKNLSIILKRLSKEENPIIKKYGNKHGCYTTIDNTINIMDFVNVDLDNTILLTLPLDIHKKTIFFPKSVIVLAGVSGYGKTTFALNFIKQNMERFKIYYFNAEMSPQALKKKLSYFRDLKVNQWSMTAIDGWDYRNIVNKIFPNDVNVIDYLEPEGSESYGIHAVISDIVNRLENGNALITIQKRPGSQLGTGGIYSIKAASLALTLDWGTLTIFKNRFREEDPFPNLDTIDFDITHGSDFYAKGDWYNLKIGKGKKTKYDYFKDKSED